MVFANGVLGSIDHTSAHDQRQPGNDAIATLNTCMCMQRKDCHSHSDGRMSRYSGIGGSYGSAMCIDFLNSDSFAGRHFRFKCPVPPFAAETSNVSTISIAVWLWPLPKLIRPLHARPSCPYARRPAPRPPWQARMR
jgi:hypothetical protein